MPRGPRAVSLGLMQSLFAGSFSYALPAHKRHVRESAAAGLLRSDAQDLEAAGFRWHRVCDETESAYDLARAAVGEIAERGELEGVDAIVYATCLPTSATASGRLGPSRDVKDLMDFPASRLQAEFGLQQAIVFGLHQQA